MLKKTSSTTRLLELAVKFCGSQEAACKAMLCTDWEMERWLAGMSEPNALAFDRMVDIIIAHQKRQIDEHGEAIRKLRSHSDALSSESMIDDGTFCEGCMALVGAGPTAEPHRALRSVKDSKGIFLKDSRGEEVLGCTTCGVRWAVGPYGWVRWFSPS
jgi:hypothetical protein